MARGVVQVGNIVTMLVSGLDLTDVKLALLGKTAGKQAIRSATREVAKHVKIEAQKLVPVDTGLLKSSIKVRALPRSRVRVGYICTTGKVDMEKASKGKRRKKHKFNAGKAFYGAFVEFGVPSRKIAAQPFLRPAAEKVSPKAAAIYRAKLKTVIAAMTDPVNVAKKAAAAEKRRAAALERKALAALKASDAITVDAEPVENDQDG